MATNAARATDSFAKVLGLSHFNFENDDEYIREKELELQKVFERNGASTEDLQLSYRNLFDTVDPTEDYIRERYKNVIAKILGKADASKDSIGDRDDTSESVSSGTDNYKEQVSTNQKHHS